MAGVLTLLLLAPFLLAPFRFQGRGAGVIAAAARSVGGTCRLRPAALAPLAALARPVGWQRRTR